MTNTTIVFMFFGGLAAFLIGLLVLGIMVVGRTALEMAYSLARVQIPPWTLYERVVAFMAYGFIVFGGGSTAIAATEYIIKWMAKA